jgi:hypothetical protein
LKPVASLLLLTLAALLLAIAGPVAAQTEDGQDELGNWLIWNGTLNFSDKWSMFTEAQLRLWEVASNPNETFARVAGQYHTSKRTLIAFGYMHSVSEPFESGAPDTSENRIYQQFTAKHRWSRPVLEHRIRTEQRWIESGGETSFRNRFRYRLQATVPVSRNQMGPQTHFLNFYDEIFLNYGNRDETFDQNREGSIYSSDVQSPDAQQLATLACSAGNARWMGESAPAARH